MTGGGGGVLAEEEYAGWTGSVGGKGGIAGGGMGGSERERLGMEAMRVVAIEFARGQGLSLSWATWVLGEVGGVEIGDIVGGEEKSVALEHETHRESVYPSSEDSPPVCC